MEMLKAGLMIAAALGSTWAAREATNVVLGAPQALVQAGQTQQEGGGAAKPAVPQISQKELDEELKRAQAEISGKPAPGDMDEFRPSRPLSADIAIALPSDM
jgi:hypothetical protein